MRDDRENDFYEAFREAMDIAIERKVDFIVHSGDLFDTWSPSNRALTEFKETALKMKEAGIPMYLIMGDHDRPKRTDYPAAKIFDFLGITLLGHDGVESTTFSKNGEEVLIVGISNLKGSRRDQLIDEYAEADLLAQSAKNSILISHQGVTGYLIDDACEADYEQLPKHFSYLAMGHVHDGAVRANSYPLFSYAGSTEMKSIREINAFLKQGKSVNLVSLENNEAHVDRIPLSKVRYQFLVESDFDHYVEDLEKTLDRYREKFNGKIPLVTLRINGTGDKEEVRRVISKYQDVNFRPPEFIAETVEIESRPGMDTASDYIKSYFTENPMLAEIAEEFYSHARQDREEALRWLREKLGLGE